MVPMFAPGNLIVLEDTGVESINERLTSIRTFRNVNRAKINGFESSVNYAGNRWFGSVTAQNLTGLDLESGDDLRDVSPASANASIGAYLFDHRSRFGLDVTAARRLLQDLARRLDADHPSAAASVREGLDETLTVIGFG